MRAMLLTAAAVIALGMPTTVSAQVNAEPLEGAEVINLADWRYDDLYADGWRAENLIGAEVYGPTGDEIGEVENIVIGPEGRILSIIAEVGGFWDLGDTHVNIPWEQVEVREGWQGVQVPVTEETVEEYSLFAERRLTAEQAATEIERVEDELETGPRAWRATELMDDYVSLEDGVNYGYVDDLVFTMEGELQAVVVRPDVGYGLPGYYAYPFYGYRYGWEPGLDTYSLPYAEDEAAGLEPFDYERFEAEGLAEAE